jgi:hypothetical protein
VNKPLISIEELKQIALREIHTYPGSEDVSAVGIYPVTDDVVESKWSVQVVSGEGVDPKPQTALRFTLSTSFLTNTICLPLMPASSALVLSGRRFVRYFLCQ